MPLFFVQKSILSPIRGRLPDGGINRPVDALPFARSLGTKGFWELATVP